MLGSLMMLASGRIASWPSSASSSLIRCAGVSFSGKLARMRPVSEMSFSFIVTPAVPTKASTIGSRENVASAGASSTFVQTISRSDMLAPLRAGLVSAELNYPRIRRALSHRRAGRASGGGPSPASFPGNARKPLTGIPYARPNRAPGTLDNCADRCRPGSQPRRRLHCGMPRRFEGGQRGQCHAGIGTRHAVTGRDSLPAAGGAERAQLDLVVAPGTPGGRRIRRDRGVIQAGDPVHIAVHQFIAQRGIETGQLAEMHWRRSVHDRGVAFDGQDLRARTDRRAIRRHSRWPWYVAR